MPCCSRATPSCAVAESSAALDTACICSAFSRSRRVIASFAINACARFSSASVFAKSAFARATAASAARIESEAPRTEAPAPVSAAFADDRPPVDDCCTMATCESAAAADAFAASSSASVRATSTSRSAGSSSNRTSPAFTSWLSWAFVALTTPPTRAAIGTTSASTCASSVLCLPATILWWTYQPPPTSTETTPRMRYARFARRLRAASVAVCLLSASMAFTPRTSRRGQVLPSASRGGTRGAAARPRMRSSAG